MDKQDLLLEIGCEELPTYAVKQLAPELNRHLCELLNANKLNFGPSQVFASPRRLAVLITDVEACQEPQLFERQGPAIAQAYDAHQQATPAALGFAKSCGVAIEELAVKDNRLYFKGEKPGRNILDILPEIAKQALSQMAIPKPMRWGNHPESFARPVHWILFLFGSEIVKTTLLGIPTSNQTRGHRYHHPDWIKIDSPQNYASILSQSGYVIANFNERVAKIRQAIEEITPSNLTAAVDPDLLNEVASLVEWPVALAGQFDPAFLQVPPEVLMTSMKVNQKYFPVLDNRGELQPAFILISNIDGKNPDLIIHGNERVLNARLTDAAFFFKNDCQQSLQSRLTHLKAVTFQKQLGSLAHKTERLVSLSAKIAQRLTEEPDTVKQAAQLSKCDLLSEMVGEFPSLQGVMGYYYAKNDDLSEACALAIKEHYYPRFSGDELPSSRAGEILALADRLDTLVGIFGIHQAPTGDKDPFALRRAALGVLRILIEKSLPLDLEQLLLQAQQAYNFHLPNATVVSQTFDFIMSRLKAWYLEKGVKAETFDAVFACRPTSPLDFDHRIYAVQQFQTLPEASALAAANKRVSNILKKQTAILSPENIDPHLFEHEEERILAEQLASQTKAAEKLCAETNYTQALQQLSALKEPVDTFFDKVMVMVEDPAKRNNRLALLSSLHKLFTQVADISLL